MIQEKLFEKARRWSVFLVFFPGVDTIFLSGSVAQGKARETSDIDFFIIAEKGRIFTACFFVKLVLKICFQLAFDEKNHAGKICPNHFITVDNLEIKEKDKYAAHLFAHNQFLAGDKRVWNNFVQANKEWINSFNESFQQPLFDIKIKFQNRHKPASFLKRKFESFFKKFQIRKINKNRQNLPVNAKIILEDEEIRFHPNPKNLGYRDSRAL